ncbi:unnamed protein product [Cylicocyclus nassatus]|uniref:Uncharacterized protein n=1 Tax=Cylicocyclus nassatus TaxID=53992 RepID=A0AA36DS53_CYLNA|nr:unnamed protein product [Cylicocyclus nassatus]
MSVHEFSFISAKAAGGGFSTALVTRHHTKGYEKKRNLILAKFSEGCNAGPGQSKGSPALEHIVNISGALLAMRAGFIRIDHVLAYEEGISGSDTSDFPFYAEENIDEDEDIIVRYGQQSSKEDQFRTEGEQRRVQRMRGKRKTEARQFVQFLARMQPNSTAAKGAVKRGVVLVLDEPPQKRMRMKISSYNNINSLGNLSSI